MDCERTSLEWTEHDFSNFDYGKGDALIITKLAGDEEAAIRTLTKMGDWNTWLENASFLCPGEGRTGFCMVLCCRVDPVFDGVQASIGQLPVSRPVFEKVVQSFQIHPAITRTIGRQIPYFSMQQHHLSDDSNESKLICTARTSSYLQDDLAASSTYLIDSGLTLGTVYGCTHLQVKHIQGRLKTFHLEHNHPSLLAALISELERDRLSELFERILDRCKLRINFRESGLHGLPLLDLNQAEMTNHLTLCLESRELMNQMKVAKRPLAKIIEENAKLEQSLLWFCHAKKPESAVLYQRLIGAGNRMNLRLQEISCEYDDKIYECNMILDNMSLTMQMTWNRFAREDNRLNLEIAQVNTKLARASTGMSQDMKQDSSQMRSIAFLTMVFLPLSTVASVFSTTFFTWNPEEGQSVVSGYFWIFVIIAVGLTSMTVGAWWFATRRSTRTYEARQEKMSLGDGFYGNV